MNERIKELSHQAKCLGNDEVLYLERIHNRTYTLDEVANIHYKKFAELLILECTIAVQDGTKAGDHSAQQIEYHFDNSPPGILHFGEEK